MPEDQKKTKIVHLNHDPIVLRTEERVRGEGGIETFKQIGEIALQRGRNEVDAAAWDLWYAGSGEASPLITTGLLHVEEQKDEKYGDHSEEPSPVSAS
jgi:hypothetical protein